MIRRRFLLLLTFAFGVPTWAQTPPKPANKYVIRKAIPLTQSANGTTGRLELLTDANLKPGMDDAETFDFPHAKIRVVTQSGSISQEKTLERSRATLETAPPLYGAKSPRKTYLLTVDYSVGMGFSIGPMTFLVEVTNGTMHFVPSQGKPIGLKSFYRTAWKFLPAEGKPNQASDILEVESKMGDDLENFAVYYRRYHWNGHEWVGHIKNRKGYWDSEKPFPKTALFPSAKP